MNLMLLDHADCRQILDPQDARLEHVRGVLRLRLGDRFAVGLVNGPRGKATVLRLEPFEIAVEWSSRPELPADITLLIGMCRPATVRKILSVAPTLGVRQLIFAECGRSDAAYCRSSLWQTGEWQLRLREGVELAFDTYVPPVLWDLPLAEAIGRLPQGGIRMALDNYEATGALSACKLAAEAPTVLAIGPERGWSAADRQQMRKADFSMLHLGERVMRVETALVAGISLMLAAMGRL